MSYQKQLEYEDSLSKSNILSWIREDLESLDDALVNKVIRYCRREILRQDYEDKIDPTELATKLLEVTLTIPDSHKTTGSGRVISSTGVQPIQAVASRIMSSFIPDQVEALCFGLELLDKCEKADVYEMHMGTDEHDLDTCIVKPLIELSDHVKFQIKQTMYMPPMLCEPREWVESNHIRKEVSAVHDEQLNLD